jgi:hypothetical protein
MMKSFIAVGSAPLYLVVGIASAIFGTLQAHSYSRDAQC